MYGTHKHSDVSRMSLVWCPNAEKKKHITLMIMMMKLSPWDDDKKG